METKIVIALTEEAGGHSWTLDVNGHIVASGWHFTRHEAKQEALEVGIPIAVRWINPRGVTPSDG